MNDFRACATCPRAGDCQAKTLRNPRLCQLANPNDPAFQPRYRATLATMPGGLVVRPKPAPRPRHGVNYAYDAEQVKPTPLSAVIASQVAVRNCPHWSKAGCGCNAAAVCALGKGEGGLVTYDDCRECLGITVLTLTGS